MRRSKFSESQIVRIGREAEAGLPVTDVIRTHAVRRAMCVTWRSKYRGATVAELTRLKELEPENARRKRRSTYRPLQDRVGRDVEVIAAL